jgi:hypothetical protein
VKPLEDDIDSGPLEAAAKDFREQLSSELEMFSIVSILLAGVAFAAFMTVPSNLIAPELEQSKNATASTTKIITAGPPAELLHGFLVCDFMTLLLGLVLTGMNVRLSTVLRYCPSGRYIIWFIHRFEPTFALMHIASMCAIHCALLAACFTAWGAWHQISEGRVMVGITATAAVCLLYFEYTWANSMFCRNHGLLGIIGRTLDHPCEVRHAYYVSRLMDCCTLLLSQQPFKLYDADRVCGGVRIKVPAAFFDDLPCTDVSCSDCFGEYGRVVMVSPPDGGKAKAITGCKDTQLLHAAASHVATAHSWLSPCSFWRVLSCPCNGRQREYPKAKEQYSHAIHIFDAACEGGGGLPGAPKVREAKEDVEAAHAIAASSSFTGFTAEQAARAAETSSRRVLLNVV